MTNKYVMGVDTGTTAIKVLLADSSGVIAAESSKMLEPFKTPHRGWVEQEPSDYQEKIIITIKDVITQSGISLEQLAGLGISNRGRGLIPMSKDGKVLRPEILWLDTRTILDKGARVKWIRENEPEVYKETYKMVGSQTWLCYRLTGEWRDSAASAFADEIQDGDTWMWDEKLVEAAEIPMEMLPELVLPGEVLGYTTKSAAEKFGLPKNLPIISGGRDKQLGTLGAGCVGNDKLMLSLGTAITLGSTAYQIFPEPVFPQKSGIPFAYDSQMGFGGGFWTLSWFTEQFRDATDMQGTERYEELDEAAKNIRPGSDGLIVLPHWFGGPWFREPMPLWERGAVLGWTARHTTAHFYRAVIEGLIHEACLYRGLMEQSLKTRFTDIRVVGGGSTSDLVMQIVADIFGTNVSRIHTSSAEALGAAMIAAKGCGIYSSVEEAVEKMSRVTDTFKPIHLNKEHYDDIHKSVYLEIYTAIESINQNLTRLAWKAEEKFPK